MRSNDAFALVLKKTSYQSHQDNQAQPIYANQQMPARTYYTYIMSSRTRVLYIGITSNLDAEYNNTEGKHDSFTKEYRCHPLSVVRKIFTAVSAIDRENQLKGWRRSKKIALIEDQNLEWHSKEKTTSKSWHTISPQTARIEIGAEIKKAPACAGVFYF